VLVLYRHFH